MCHHVEIAYQIFNGQYMQRIVSRISSYLNTEGPMIFLGMSETRNNVEQIVVNNKNNNTRIVLNIILHDDYEKNDAHIQMMTAELLKARLISTEGCQRIAWRST